MRSAALSICEHPHCNYWYSSPMKMLLTSSAVTVNGRLPAKLENVRRENENILCVHMCIALCHPFPPAGTIKHDVDDLEEE